MIIRPRRSVLYMPGSNARALDKARTLPADAVIFDLEDGVGPEQKEVARSQVVAAVRAGGYGAREIVIRINSLESPWGGADMRAAATSGADAVLIPKVATPGDVMVAAKELREAGAPDAMALWAMMETAQAILNADFVARTAEDPASRLAVFVMGTNDLAKETRARLTRGRPAMLPWLATCVAAARAHGVDILDGVFGDLKNAAGFAEECEQGRDMGMDGKTLIHPDQIAPCNTAFSPTVDEVAWSQRLIEAFEQPENAGKGAISLDGRMVERLHAEMARRTLAIAAAVAGRAA